jgi:hypothetical protein
MFWLFTPDDGGKDGRKIKYLSEPERWRHLDPALFDLLQEIIRAENRQPLEFLERKGLIPDAIYFDWLTPDRKDQRIRFMQDGLQALRPADLIFFDPDNGLEVKSRQVGRKWSSKYLF